MSAGPGIWTRPFRSTFIGSAPRLFGGLIIEETYKRSSRLMSSGGLPEAPYGKEVRCELS